MHFVVGFGVRRLYVTRRTFGCCLGRRKTGKKCTTYILHLAKNNPYAKPTHTGEREGRGIYSALIAKEGYSAHY